MGNLKKEIELQMKQDEARGKFEEQISLLEKNKQDLVRQAAEAKLSGYTANYELAADNILFIQDAIVSLKQTKMNFDIVAVTGDITSTLNSAFNAMATMARGNVKLPNYKKIMSTQAKLSQYIKEAAVGQKMVKGMIGRSNPATRLSRTPEERESVNALINAEMAKMSGTVPSSGTMSLADEIAREKNSTIK